MYYVNPVKGRYPNKKGEICIDRITLKSNGLAEKLGQKIQLTCDDTSENVTYTLVGIIEVQKQDTGETYDTRFYPEEMFSTSNMNNVNFPYAYIYPEEVKNPKGIHILADVVKKENSANVVQSYLDDSDLLSDLHITTDRSFGREWTIANILGADTNGDSLANVVSSSMENGKYISRWIYKVSYAGIIAVKFLYWFWWGYLTRFVWISVESMITMGLCFGWE